MHRTHTGRILLALVLAALAPTAQSAAQLPDGRRAGHPGGWYPGQAFAPLTAGTVGAAPAPRAVVPPSSYSLGLEGDVALGGFVFKEGHALLHTDGGPGYGNTALGIDALVSLTLGAPYETSGFFNSALGENALRFTTAGSGNSAVGTYSLLYNSSGSYNSAVGTRALFSNNYGSNNSALGSDALFANVYGSYNMAIGARSLFHSSTGYYNTAVGVDALRYLEYGGGAGGSRNVAIGAEAGVSLAEGDDNVYIAGDAPAAVESATVRIGSPGVQTRAFVAGVANSSITELHAVYVDADGQLGQMSSSRRYKRDIRDVGELSERLQELRPVSFRYRREGEDGRVRFGLVAEEVAARFPELVGVDAGGRPETVRYHLLSSLLLAELQRQQRLIDQQADRIEALESRLPRASDGG